MKSLSRVIKFLKPYRKQAFLSILFLIFVVLLDLAIPRLVQQIIDEGIVPKDLNVVKQTTWIMLGVSFSNMVFAIIYNTFSVYVSEGFGRDLRKAIFQKVQELSYPNLDQLKTGNLIVRLTSDVAVVQNTVRMALRIGIRVPLILIGSLILMFMTDAQLTFKVLPLFLVIMLVVWLFVDKLGPLFAQLQKRLDGLNTVLQENVAGVRVVKAFSQRRHEEDRFENANEGFTEQHIKIMRFMSSFLPILTLLINLAIVVVIWVGGYQAVSGTLSLGAIVAFTDYLMTTLAPLTLLVSMANAFAAGFASADRICGIFDTMPFIQDSPDAVPFSPDMAGFVAFQNVGFSYAGAENECVLEGITLKAEPGQMIAILGATGSGKSTLVNLIPRFYDVSSGSITIDGIDVRKIRNDTLLANISITPQETILFTGSIRDNICYGNPAANEEEIIQAAKAAQAHDFIMELPDGYATSVAQRGVNLSGGQKQRIAIARAILRKPKILILDDSTSAVDVETETRIQSALVRILKKSTCFIVAQRISTVLNADKIIVLDNGKIAAQGTHTELIKSSRIYKEIYDSQLGDGNHALKDILQKTKLEGAKANG